MRIVVLIVEGQVADLDLRERELRRRQLHESVGELAVERVAAQAADDDGDVIVAHCVVPRFLVGLAGEFKHGRIAGSGQYADEHTVSGRSPPAGVN